MGILKGCARLLCEEHARRPFRGSLLQLGRALVFLTLPELRELADEVGIELREVDEVRLSQDPRLARLGCIDDRTFFGMLGFSEVKSLDVSDYEGADVIADLNRPLPKILHGRFDVVLDVGTLHHVFHLPEALANVHRALRVGGRAILGMVASNNHVDHGFYMFSPTLFCDYFEANSYEVVTARLLEFVHSWLAGRLFTSRWRVYDYSPGCLDEISYGGFGDRQLALYFVATRRKESTCHAIPQQSYFRRVWDDAAGALGHEDQANRWSDGLRTGLARLAARNPAVERLLVGTKRCLAWLRGAHGRRPPVEVAGSPRVRGDLSRVSDQATSASTRRHISSSSTS